MRRIDKAANPLVLDAQHTTGNACIELVVVVAEQIESGELVNDLFHNLCGNLHDEHIVWTVRYEVYINRWSIADRGFVAKHNNIIWM